MKALGLRIAGLACAGILVASCGSGAPGERALGRGTDAADPAAEVSTSTVAPPVAAAPPSTNSQKADVAEGGQASAAGGASSSPPPPPETPLRQAPAPADPSKPFVLEVEAPACAHPGDTLPVTINTEPDVDVALIVAFSDGSDHGTTNLGTTDDAGRYVTSIEIAPDVPTGQARLLVAAGTSGKRGDAVEHPVEIRSVVHPCD